MALRPQTKRIIADLDPGEGILDGGPARSKALDRRAFERLEGHFGGVTGVRHYAKSRGVGAATFMDAEWVATDNALYYVHFNAGTKYRWPWADIQQLVACRGALPWTKRLTLRTEIETVDVAVSRRAAVFLVSLSQGRVE